MNTHSDRENNFGNALRHSILFSLFVFTITIGILVIISFFALKLDVYDSISARLGAAILIIVSIFVGRVFSRKDNGIGFAMIRGTALSLIAFFISLFATNTAGVTEKLLFALILFASSVIGAVLHKSQGTNKAPKLSKEIEKRRKIRH